MELIEVLKGKSTHALSEEAIKVLSNNIVDYIKMENQGIVPGLSKHEQFAYLDSTQPLLEPPTAIVGAEVARPDVITAKTKRTPKVPIQKREAVKSPLRFRDDKLAKPLGIHDTSHSDRVRDIIRMRNLAIPVPELGDDEPAKDLVADHKPFSEDDIVPRQICDWELEPKKRVGHCDEPCNCPLQNPAGMSSEDIGMTFALPESESEDEDSEDEAAARPVDDNGPIASRTQHALSQNPESLPKKPHLEKQLPCVTVPKKRLTPKPEQAEGPSSQSQKDTPMPKDQQATFETRQIMPVKKITLSKGTSTMREPTATSEDIPESPQTTSKLSGDLEFASFAADTKQSLLDSQAPPTLSSSIPKPKRSSPPNPSSVFFPRFATRASGFASSQVGDRVAARMQYRSLSAGSSETQSPSRTRPSRLQYSPADSPTAATKHSSENTESMSELDFIYHHSPSSLTQENAKVQQALRTRGQAIKTDPGPRKEQGRVRVAGNVDDHVLSMFSGKMTEKEECAMKKQKRS
ncbi:hypothetical protein CC86DRAFT_410980 [Ophiobolus disseminans]|uniref:Uncharacterized protein n=1 Tax=Ophiobolus disseminans TaxID=1469910 RepID=A0A6A6ZNS3_9PLEO|nr:hypothetical protein CC86DRAFT_410980 [Ophiobolus disseminans]